MSLLTGPRGQAATRWNTAGAFWVVSYGKTSCCVDVGNRAYYGRFHWSATEYLNDRILMAMMNLSFIVKLQPTDQAIEVTLQSRKIVTLAKSPESYEYFTRLLTGALESKHPQHPVGLAISEENEILAVERADNDFVVRIIPEDKETFNVWLQGHDGIFKLDRNHPSFYRIYTTLDTSRTDSQRIWFVADGELKILDVLLAEA